MDRDEADIVLYMIALLVGLAVIAMIITMILD